MVPHRYLPLLLLPFSWERFWWLGKQGAQVLYVWPFSLVGYLLAANVLLALVIQRPFSHEKWKRHYWLVFSNLLFLPVILAIATVAWNDTSPVARPEPNVIAEWANNAIDLISLAVPIISVYYMKGSRWFAIAVSLLQIWFLLIASFIAGMAISGDWL